MRAFSAARYVMYEFKLIGNFTLIAQQITDVFYNSFSASEGRAEGELIRTLVAHLMEDTPKPDMFIFAALHDNNVIGCAVFSRLTYTNDARDVFILSPMAIQPNHQNKGIGQSLLRESIALLKDHGIDILMTYGDPNYYEKVGFLTVTEQMAPPPFPLSMPIGWIGQSLHGDEIAPLQGTCTCVSALNNPAIW
jgi:putative acetyltransferase